MIEVVFLILAVLWGGFATVINAFQWLNARRDIVLGITPTQKPVNRAIGNMILYNDWVPMMIALGLFHVLVGLSVFFAPDLIAAEPDKSVIAPVASQGAGIVQASRDGNGDAAIIAITYSSLGLTAIAAFGLLATLVTGLGDFKAMRAAINTLPA